MSNLAELLAISAREKAAQPGSAPLPSSEADFSLDLPAARLNVEAMATLEGLRGSVVGGSSETLLATHLGDLFVRGLHLVPFPLLMSFLFGRLPS